MKSFSILLGASCSITIIIASVIALYVNRRTSYCNSDEETEKKKKKDLMNNLFAKNGVLEMIGNTPLVLLVNISNETQCKIYGKAEYLNPGGSSKDRVALAIIEDGEKNGKLIPGKSVIYEGTVGSTGISLTTVAKAKGYECVIIMPDDVAKEKSQLLKHLGADVKLVRPVSIVDPNHFVRAAESFAKEDINGYFANQFENLSNYNAHFERTGPEIYNQIIGNGENLDAIVCGAGTGGTIAGVSRYLKLKDPNIKAYLADPQGSGLHNLVLHGVCYSKEESEGKRKRHQVDSIVEGMGLNRVTDNFKMAQLDGSFKITDSQAIQTAHYLSQKEGLFLGSTSAVNVAAAVLLAKKLGPGHTIVTFLPDSGSRHLSRFWSIAAETKSPSNLSFLAAN